MKLIFFYILRRFFVHLRVESDIVVLEKTLVIRRKTVLRRSGIVRTQVRRTAVMRVLGAKEVTLFTEHGKMRFYLRENEQSEILPVRGKNAVKPRFREVIFGAFIDARALAGITFFAVTLSKIGKILGENYLDSAIRALFTTAESVTEALAIAHIVIPRAFVFIGISALGAWFLGFLRKAIMLASFELSVGNGAVVVKSGFVTLYENALVRNSAVISRETLFSLITKRKTLYCRKVMILPCADKWRCERLLRSYFGMSVPDKMPVKSPNRAVFGHCAVPMWLFAIFSVLFALLFITGNESALLLRSALTAGMIISGYLTALYALYMKSENHVFSRNFTAISCKKTAALYTAFLPCGILFSSGKWGEFAVPRGLPVSATLSQSAFDKLSALCTLKVTLPERSAFRARLVPLAELFRG